MSDVIDFLDRLGREAHLRHATGVEMKQALSGAGIDISLQEAIMSADQRRLEDLLGADTNVCCMIYIPEDEEDAPPEDESVRTRGAA